MNNGNQKEETKMKKSYIIKAVNSEVDTCFCCGRTDLKKVVWLAERIDGIEHDPSPYGTTCAAKAVANKIGGDEYTTAYNRRAAKDAIKLSERNKKESFVFSR